MKLQKLTAFLLAAVCAAAPAASHGLTPQSPLTVSAEDTAVITKLPDWIPNDYESALAFRNTYGATRTADGLICTVFKQQYEKVPDGEPQGVKRYALTITGDAPKMLKDVVCGSEDSQYCYEIVVVQPLTDGDYAVAMADTWVKSSSLEPELDYVHYIGYYTFNLDSDGNITETDLNSWLPDCITEYKAFKEQYSPVSVRDNYLVFCLEQNAGTAYSWRPKFDGSSDCLSNADLWECSAETAVPLEGGTMCLLSVFKAAKDGYVKIDYEYRSALSDDTKPAEKTLTADCMVLDDAQTILLPDAVRMQFTDADTGALLKFPNAEQPLRVLPTLAYQTETDGVYDYADLAAPLADSNPFVWHCPQHRTADIFGLDLNADTLPEGYTLPAEYKKMKQFENGARDVTFQLKKAASEAGQYQAKITLLDYDTGEPVIINYDREFRLCDMVYYDLGGEDEDAVIANITENPCLVTNLSEKPVEFENVQLKSPRHYVYPTDETNRVDREYCTVTLDKNGMYNMTYRLKFAPTGDFNGDKKFNAEDIQAMQRRLLCDPNAVEKYWKAADFNNDSRIDASDLTLMKQAYIDKRQPPVAVSITETGGYDGIHIEWNMYAENGRYFLSRWDANPRFIDGKPVENEKTTVEITEAEYSEIMAIDYDKIIEEYYAITHLPVLDGVNYRTVLTRADGSTRTTGANMTSVLLRFDDILENHLSTTTKKQ